MQASAMRRAPPRPSPCPPRATPTKQARSRGWRVGNETANTQELAGKGPELVQRRVVGSARSVKLTGDVLLGSVTLDQVKNRLQVALTARLLFLHSPLRSWAAMMLRWISEVPS